MARLRRLSGRLAGAGALAVAGVVTFAGVASAHGHTDHATCNSLSVDLENYNDKVANSVVVTIGGKVELDNQNFGKELKQVFDVPIDHPQPITYEIKVVAGDDPDPKPGDNNGWTFTDGGQILPCLPPPGWPRP
ncbi:hypothetical protein LN042_04750 [Kitasatospora sp. RB6PN24]|uniref:hypothetical protein n=1 Tax=Kitasatospora humi TaxID=2893891 RepID=UPI001E457809|nr:hypothetical protein [Kitasatospora humi]MCC9306425.1 hypothetical protein [Kitasatospora humi]